MPCTLASLLSAVSPAGGAERIKTQRQCLGPWRGALCAETLIENGSLCRLSGSVHRGGPQAQTPSSCLLSPQIKTYELLWCDLITKANRNFISCEVACHFLLPLFFGPINTLIVRNMQLSLDCIWGREECVVLGRGPGYFNTVTLLAICLIAWFPSPPTHTAIYHFNGMLQNITLCNVFKLINYIRKILGFFNGKWVFRGIFSH